MGTLKWSDFNNDNNIILITLGGSVGTDEKISEIAEIVSANPILRRRLFIGHGNPLIDQKARWINKIRDKIIEIFNQMKDLGHHPKIILVGKSMGGCVLHAVAKELNNKDIKVDLFIGVDMSCHATAPTACHFKAYQDDPSENSDEAKIFYDNVIKLKNFYQVTEKAGVHQCGHPAIRDHEIGEQPDLEYTNINVNWYNYNWITGRKVSRDERLGVKCEGVEIESFKPYEGVSSTSTFPTSLVTPSSSNRQKKRFELLIDYGFTLNMVLCSNADHMSIDTCGGLLKVIYWLIYEEIGYTDLFPKYSLTAEVKYNGDKIQSKTIDFLDIKKDKVSMIFNLEYDVHNIGKTVRVRIKPSDGDQSDQHRDKKTFTM
ncbi:MAG: hypothetical protein FK734_07960 [Asgard group archaeon]|nr:hypothetical protein [Asgard group archaeon]